LTTIITSVVVSLVVSLITLYVVQPIQGQKQLIGEIDDATRYYRTATSKVRADWKNQGEREAAKAKAEEATQALLMLSARLGASPATFPARGKSYRLYENPLTWSHRGRTLVKPLVSLRRGRIG
jgi:hypothetical protein